MYLQHHGTDVGIHNDVALLLAGENRPEAAVEHYRLALSLDTHPPTDYRVRTNLGLLLVRMVGNSPQSREEGIHLQAEAIDIARRLSQVNNDTQARRDLPTLLLNMGSVVDSLRNHGTNSADSPVSYWQEALSLTPNLTRCLEAIANSNGRRIMSPHLTITTARYRCAVPSEQGEHALQPKMAAAIRIKATTVLPRVYDSSDDILRWRWKYMRNYAACSKKTRRANRFQIPQGPRWTYLVYQGLENRRPREMLARIYLRACPSLSGSMDGDGFVRAGVERKALCGDGDAVCTSRPLRIGFFSEYWSEHTTTKLLEKVLAGLSQSQYQSVLSVELISTAPALRDEFTRRLEAMVGPIRLVPGMPDLFESRKIIRQRNLDVLVFAEIGMGMTAYFLAFAGEHLARRTVMFWGHGVTSGIDAVDYFITSRSFSSTTNAPPEALQDSWTERLYLMSSITTAFERPPIPGSNISRTCAYCAVFPARAALLSCPYEFVQVSSSWTPTQSAAGRASGRARSCRRERVKWSQKIVDRLRERCTAAPAQTQIRAAAELLPLLLPPPPMRQSYRGCASDEARKVLVLSAGRACRGAAFPDHEFGDGHGDDRSRHSVRHTRRKQLELSAPTLRPSTARAVGDDG